MEKRKMGMVFDKLFDNGSMPKNYRITKMNSTRLIKALLEFGSEIEFVQHEVLPEIKEIRKLKTHYTPIPKPETKDVPRKTWEDLANEIGQEWNDGEFYK